MGTDYVDVREGKAFWVVEHDGRFSNQDVNRMYLGDVVDGQVKLAGHMGGGKVGLRELKTGARNFWNEYGDISDLPGQGQVKTVRSAVGRLAKGTAFESKGAFAQVAEGAGEGLETGSKAVLNAASSTVVSTVTLGFVDSYNIVEVTQEDLDRGYGLSYGLARAGTEILMGDRKSVV